MHSRCETGSEHRKEFVKKVADKLGLPPEKVAAAIQEARGERVNQLVTHRLQRSVEDGVITEAEADQIRQWWKKRPAAVTKLGSGRMHGGGFGRYGK